MPVEAINNKNSNNTLNRTIGAVAIGAAAGATYGYFSKPYLNGAIASDSFCDTLFSTAKKAKPEIFASLDSAWKSIKQIKTPEQLKNVIITYMDFAKQIIKSQNPEMTFANAKENILKTISSLDKTDNPELSNIINKIGNVKNYDELMKEVNSILDKQIKEADIKTLENITKGLEDNFKTLKKVIGSTLLYTSSMNKALSGGAKQASIIDKLVNGVKTKLQLKAAGIYGVGAAAVAGIGTYLYQNSKNNSTKKA